MWPRVLPEAWHWARRLCMASIYFTLTNLKLLKPRQCSKSIFEPTPAYIHVEEAHFLYKCRSSKAITEMP